MAPVYTLPYCRFFSLEEVVPGVFAATARPGVSTGAP